MQTSGSRSGAWAPEGGLQSAPADPTGFINMLPKQPALFWGKFMNENQNFNNISEAGCRDLLPFSYNSAREVSHR